MHFWRTSLLLVLTAAWSGVQPVSISALGSAPHSSRKRAKSD